jgi:murein DD-endopeptidase MepM/ murein hydrolase activator NlpD
VLQFPIVGYDSNHQPPYSSIETWASKAGSVDAEATIFAGLPGNPAQQNRSEPDQMEKPYMTNEAGVSFEQAHPNSARYRQNNAQSQEDFSPPQQHLDYATTSPTSINFVSRHPEASAQAGYTTLSSLSDVQLTQLNALNHVLNRMNDQVQRLLTDQVTPLRLAGHLSVLMVAAVVLILSQITIPEWELRLEPTPSASSSGGFSGFSERSVAAQANIAFDYGNDSLRPNIVFGLGERAPKAPSQEPSRPQISYYTVKAGDTVLGIAQRFGLQPETLMWANAFIEQNPDRLRIGDQLRILPVDGVLHVVKRGDTLSGIASTYKTDMQAIVAFAGNNIKSINDPLPIGKEIIVPGGVKPYVAPATSAASTAYSVQRPPDAPAGSGNFSWPAAGYISQGYWRAHPAIDIAGWLGAPVSAADSGFVVTAGGGWNGGYGNHVLIDHGNGFTTLYAHLNSIFVKPGETVSRGQQIGTMGSTGNSTGPHLHFEIRYNGTPYNPANYLK